MIKKLLLAAGATTILAAAAMMGQITRVRADFTVAPPSCTLGSVDVSASANRHTYKYDLNCDDNSSYHAEAAYDPAQQLAQERLVGTSYPFAVDAVWSCATDPWIAQTAVQCTFTQGTSSNLAGAFGYLFSQFSAGAGGYPLTPSYIDAYSRHALAAQLQNAINRLQTPAPQPAPDSIVVTKVPGARTVNVEPFSPTADLVAVGISGPGMLVQGTNQTYTATIRNDGVAVNGRVEVVISLVAPLVYLVGAVDPGAGFVCDAAPFSSTIHCGGGTLAQGQSATIAFHAFASTAGNAKLLLSINPNNSVAESNTDNNSAALDVTIQ
jgi:hypothetical protein